jgi:DNA repair protein RadC
VGSIVVRPAEIFRPAVRVNAPSIVIVHNHPSGEATPSPEDIGITREIVKAGHNLAIKVLDHLILGAGKQFVSLKERGVGFP